MPREAIHKVAVTVLAMALCGLSNAVPTRLAVITTEPGQENVADLLTVELSKLPDMALLERVEIEKVLREQALAVANGDLLTLGRILGADELLVLGVSAENTNQFLQTRLAAVKPGVVIWSERFSWPLDEPGEWSEGLPSFLAPLIPKLAALERDAVPVSVVSLGSAIRSAEAQEMERQLTLFTIERLSREPRLFILERRRMELLESEKEFGGVDDSDFWNGSWLLEGTVDRDGYSQETMTIHARLIPLDGDAHMLVGVSSPRGDLAIAITALTDLIMENLQMDSSDAMWKPESEAERYFEEAKWAWHWKMFKEPIVPITPRMWFKKPAPGQGDVCRTKSSRTKPEAKAEHEIWMATASARK